ncbi:MAG: diguanylate cyclase, partial [Chloroflexi bacterium]|nr:diguanylate cyclase [Chloroflexota bacterium]
PGNLPVTVTFSIGAAVFEDGMRDIGDLLRNADDAMYHAKHSGRNCVKVYQGVPPPPEGVLRHRRWTGRKNHR